MIMDDWNLFSEVFITIESLASSSHCFAASPTLGISRHFNFGSSDWYLVLSLGVLSFNSQYLHY